MRLHRHIDGNQLDFPNDRIFVAEDKLVALDTFVTKATAPFERMIGFTLLGTQTTQTIFRSPNGYRNCQSPLAANSAMSQPV